MSNCNGPTFCEVCGVPGDYISVEEWCTCAEHFTTVRPATPLFDWRTGVRLGPYEDVGDGLGPIPPGNQRYPMTHCQICGAPGMYIGADGWCTCRAHLHAPRPEHTRFSWTDGVAHDENGQRVRGAPPSPSPKNTTCEICGSMGNIPNVDGWFTCDDHRHTRRPTRRLWHWSTGNRLGPYDDLPDDEQPGPLIRSFD